MSLLAAAADSFTRESSMTSAGGAMRADRHGRYIIVLMSPFELGTTSRALDEEEWNEIELGSERTTSGQANDSAREEAKRDSGGAILELRRLTGFTWVQLGGLFHVVRRSLHFWASGKPLNAPNEVHLYRTLSTIRTIDRGSASENRALLLKERGGLIPFDLLASGRYDEVVALLGRGPGRPQGELPPLSLKAREVRRPLPPTALADALQESVHRDRGRGRPVRTRKAKRRGRE